jgi:hypothetical protein
MTVDEALDMADSLDFPAVRLRRHELSPLGQSTVTLAEEVRRLRAENARLVDAAGPEYHEAPADDDSFCDCMAFAKSKGRME